MIEVTVVIPTFNHAAFVGEAIRSVLKSNIEVEVIVVDDGSVDGTAEVVRGFSSVRYTHQANAGAAAAINAGMDLARTEVVAILNDDDVYGPRHLGMSLQRLRQCGAELCLSTPWLIGSGPMRVQMEVHEQVSAVLITRYGRALSLLAHNWFVSTSAMVMTKSVWKQLGGFRPLQLCHDLDFALRALATGVRLAYVEEPSWGYRCHESNSVTGVSPEVQRSELVEVLAAVRGLEMTTDLAAFGYGALVPQATPGDNH